MREAKQYEIYGHLPLLVGFPRSGNHFVNAVLELYFDRHRAPPQDKGLTFLNRRSNNYMWLAIHDHDLDIIPKNKSILLTRDPVDVLYSWSAVNKKTNNKHFIVDESLRYRNFIEKWAMQCDEYITYEDFIHRPEIPIEKVCQVFQQDFCIEKALESSQCVTKENLHAKAAHGSKYHGKHHLSQTYQNNRKAFRKSWADTIYQVVISSKTKEFLNVKQ